VHEQVPVPADGEAFELVEVGDGLLDDPPDGAEADDLLAAALRDDRLDSSRSQPLAERKRVVAAVCEDDLGSTTRASDSPGNGWDGLDKVLGGLDVGYVPSGCEDRQRDSVAVAGNVVLGAGSAPVYR